MEWITQNWDSVLAVIGGVVALASAIVKITPSVKDDAILAKVVAFLSYFSVVNTKKDQAAIDKTK